MVTSIIRLKKVMQYRKKQVKMIPLLPDVSVEEEINKFFDSFVNPNDILEIKVSQYYILIIYLP